MNGAFGAIWVLIGFYSFYKLLDIFDGLRHFIYFIYNNVKNYLDINNQLF